MSPLILIPGVASGPVVAFPSRVGSTSGATSDLTANPVMDLSDLPLTEGNVLVLAFRCESTTHSGPSEWTSRGVLAATGETDKLSIWSKVVGSSESTSQAFNKSGSNRAAWVIFEYEDAHGEVEVAFAQGLDAGVITPSWGEAMTTWVAVAGVSASANTLTAPSGYGSQVDGASVSNTLASRSRCAMADRENEAASENPAAWGETGTVFFPISAVVAVRPQ